MNYRIMEKEAFDIVEKVSAHAVDQEESAKTVPAFWTASHEDGTVSKLLEITSDESYLFGICYGNLPENAKTFDYSIAAACGKDTAVPEGFRKTTIPART